MSSKKAKIKKPENVIASANHALVLFKTLEPIPLLPGGEGRDEGIVPPTSFTRPANPAPNNAQPAHKKLKSSNRCPLSRPTGEIVENHPKTEFYKKQNFGPPEFLFSGRITLFPKI